MENRDSMIIYRSFYEAIKELGDKEQAILWNAVFSYGLDFTEPQLSGICKTVFTLIKPQLDANIKRYENGKKPKPKQNLSKTEAKDKQTGSKTVTNVNVNENVNNNVNQNVAFVADANKDQKDYRMYLYNTIKDEYQISRDQLFAKCKIDLSRRNEIWNAFIENSIENIPLIEDQKHAWNSFKKFINDNQETYKINGKANFTGF